MPAQALTGGVFAAASTRVLSAVDVKRLKTHDVGEHCLQIHAAEFLRCVAVVMGVQPLGCSENALRRRLSARPSRRRQDVLEDMVRDQDVVHVVFEFGREVEVVQRHGDDDAFVGFELFQQRNHFVGGRPLVRSRRFAASSSRRCANG